MYLAIIQPGTYLDFGDTVAFRINDEVIERGILNEQGEISGRAQAALRPISAADFYKILELGLSDEDGILPREGELVDVSGLGEAAAIFERPEARRCIEQLSNRVVRDKNFRKTILRAYEERCAITGLKLINGGGRAEVEAAHIRPVEYDGPDIVSNGLALSGTAHWMFDRGLVGLPPDLEIVVSRQANDRVAVEGLINDTGRLIVPNRLADRPRSEFVAWHRDNCFKA